MKVKVNISEGPADKIKKAVQTDTSVSIRLAHEDLSGEHVLALTQAQINKITKAYQNGTGVILKMSKTQLKHNTRIDGGFIPLILPALAAAGKFLASSALPALATGTLTGIGATAGTKAVEKIDGNGILYVKKEGRGYKISSTGQGLYLAPWRKGSSLGDGLYLKSGDKYTDGSGLLLGPNSPFRNIRGHVVVYWECFYKKGVTL